MKTALPAIAVLLLGVLAFVNLSLLNANSRLKEQRAQLQRQVETLENNLTAATSQISNLSQVLQETMEAVNPNLEAMRERLQQQIDRNLPDNPDSPSLQ